MHREIGPDGSKGGIIGAPPPIFVSVKTIEAFPSAGAFHACCDFGQTAAHFGKFDALVRDHPWLNIFIQPPWIADGKTDEQPAMTIPRAWHGFIFPMSISEEVSMTRRPAQTIPLQRRNDSGAQIIRAAIGLNEIV